MLVAFPGAVVCTVPVASLSSLQEIEIQILTYAQDVVIPTVLVRSVVSSLEMDFVTPILKVSESS